MVFGLLIAFFPQVTTLIMIELIGIFLIVVSFGAIMLSATAPGGLKGSILLAIIGIILILLRACNHSFTLCEG